MNFSLLNMLEKKLTGNRVAELRLFWQRVVLSVVHIMNVRFVIVQEPAKKQMELPDTVGLKEIFRSSMHLIMQVICELLHKLCTPVMNNGLAVTYN